MTEKASTQIVKRVAIHRDCHPQELPPLFEAVEVDALDRLVDRLPDDPPIEAVEFDYADTNVTVLSDGEVRIDDA